MKINYIRQQGFTLVELMISLVIGLVIVLGVVTVYLGSARSQTTNAAIIEVQNAARFAHHFFSTELQPAGFISVCPDESEHIINLLDNADDRYSNTGPNTLYNMNFPVMSWDTLASFNNSTRLSTYIKDIIDNDYLRGHIILVQHASNYNKATLANNLSGGSDVSLSPAGNFEPGNILLISDMYRCIIFQNQLDGVSAIELEGVLRPGNDPEAFPTFNEDPIEKDLAKIFQITSNIYYIGQGNTLKRLPLSTGLNIDGSDIEELVDGIEDLRFEFGLIDDNRALEVMHNASDIHASSSLNWSDVGMVRANLLVRSQNANIIDEATPVAHAPFDTFCSDNDEDDEDPVAQCQDRRLRYVFSHTLGIRNTLP